MSILDVGILTGFSVMKDTIDKVKLVVFYPRKTELNLSHLQNNSLDVGYCLEVMILLYKRSHTSPYSTLLFKKDYHIGTLFTIDLCYKFLTVVEI